MMLIHFGAACLWQADKTWLTDKARSLEDLHLIVCCIIMHSGLSSWQGDWRNCGARQGFGSQWILIWIRTRGM